MVYRGSTIYLSDKKISIIKYINISLVILKSE